MQSKKENTVADEANKSKITGRWVRLRAPDLPTDREDAFKVAQRDSERTRRCTIELTYEKKACINNNAPNRKSARDVGQIALRRPSAGVSRGGGGDKGPRISEIVAKKTPTPRRRDRPYLRACTRVHKRARARSIFPCFAERIRSPIANFVYIRALLPIPFCSSLRAPVSLIPFLCGDEFIVRGTSTGLTVGRKMATGSCREALIALKSIENPR